MIHILPSFALAILGDGKTIVGTLSSNTCSWSGGTLIDAEPERIDTTIDSGVIAALTYDGRILAGQNTTRLDDITPKLESIMGADIACIQNICVRGRSVVVWGGSSIGLIKLSKSINPVSAYSCTFKSEIELISIDSEWCLVKTRDNRLFGVPIKEQSRSSLISGGAPLVLDHGTELFFRDTASITEVHAGDTWFVLLLKNCSVYGCEYYGSLSTPRPIEQIMFPEGEIVVRIVNTGSHIIYLTASNNCYEQNVTGIVNWRWYPNPTLYLTGYVIENIFPGSWSRIVIQCREARRVGFVLVTYVVSIFPPTSNTKRIVHLPALDGMTLVSVTCGPYYRYCFVTDDGKVYWSHNMNSNKPTLTRDTFFDANPIAAERTKAMIGSTRSILSEP